MVVPAARERVIAQLTQSFAHDQISLDEFEHRVTAAYGAATSQELAALTADWPAPVSGPSPTAAVPVQISAVQGNIERSGLFAVPSHFKIQVLAGNVELDLHRAHFESGVTEISLNALVGNIEIQLPAHVQVENYASSLLASFGCREQREEKPFPPLDRPVLVVRFTGRSVLSNVSVILV